MYVMVISPKDLDDENEKEAGSALFKCLTYPRASGEMYQ